MSRLLSLFGDEQPTGFPPTSTDECNGATDAEVLTFYRVQPILRSELDAVLGLSSCGTNAKEYINYNMRPVHEALLQRGLLRQTIHPILPIVAEDGTTPTTVGSLKLELLSALVCSTRATHPTNVDGMPPVVGTKGFAARFAEAVKSRGDNVLGEIFSWRYEDPQQVPLKRVAVQQQAPNNNSEYAPSSVVEAPPTVTVPRPPSELPASRRPWLRASADKRSFVDLPSRAVNEGAPTVEDGKHHDPLVMVVHSLQDHLASLPRNCRLYVIINDY